MQKKANSIRDAVCDTSWGFRLDEEVWGVGGREESTSNDNNDYEPYHYSTCLNKLKCNHINVTFNDAKQK